MPGIERIVPSLISNLKSNADSQDEYTGGEIELEPTDMIEENAEEGAVEPPDLPHFANLVGHLDDVELNKIGAAVIEGYEADKSSRIGWVETIEKGIKLLGLKIEENNDPFEGACGAYHPLIMEASIKFQSKATLELFPPNGPVKTKIQGVITEDLQKRARRIKDFLNYQILEKMPEYYGDSDRLLFTVALFGTVHRKIKYSASKDRPVTELLTYENFVISDKAKNLEDCERYTHQMELSSNDMLRAIASGEFIEPSQTIYPDQSGEADERDAIEELKGFTRPQDDRSLTYTVLEQHVNINLPAPFDNPYDIADPYVICVDLHSGKVLSIVRNWSEDQDDPLNRQKLLWFDDWHFVPGTGYHSFGYIHLLGNLQLSLTTVLRSLIDSGQFANLQGGFKLKGVKISGKDVDPISPGEFRDVEATTDDINKAIKALPFKEPSTVLYNMLSFMEGRAQQFADSTEAVVNEATNYGPVGTTMALLEASTKFYSAIHKRLHFSQKREINIIARILKENVRSASYEYPEDGTFEEDFSGPISIIPVSDPNIPTAAHRMMMANAALDIAMKAPEISDKREAVRSALLAMGTIDVDKIIPPISAAQQLDPVSDIQSAVRGTPIQAFEGQDHDSHIKIKTAWISDPSNGGNPAMQQAVPIVLANIREHMMLQYKEQLAGAISNMNPEDVKGASTDDFVIAVAAQKLAETNAQLAKAGTEDPMQKVADAEMMKAATDAQKLEHKKLVDFASLSQSSQKIGLDIVKEQNRHNEKKVELGQGASEHDFRKGSKLIDTALANIKQKEVDKTPKK